jgi:predicted nucleic acid-binding protein
MTKLAYVYDSWALMAFLENEPSADMVEQLIAEAQESNSKLLITTVNLGEIWYSTARVKSEVIADEKITEIRNLGFESVDADWELARRAAAFKAKYRLAYADCFAAALAKVRKLPLVTGDPEFKQLKKEVEIHWVGGLP